MSEVMLLGEAATLIYYVTDDNGVATSPATAVLTITLPDGTTATPTITEDPTSVGMFEVSYTPPAAGMYSAVFTTTVPAGSDAASFLVVVTEYPVALADVKSYLGDVSETDGEITAALAAEVAAQARRCRLSPYTADLAEALKRRVARNLAARRVPLATYTAFEGGGGTSTRVPTNDAEILRLERPYRKMVAR